MKREIKSTGVWVTPLCFGASGLGDMPDTYGYEVSKTRARETLDAIFESEINFIDGFQGFIDTLRTDSMQYAVATAM